MRKEDQIRQGEKLLRYLDEKTTAMADGIYGNPVSDYICPKQAGAEKEKFFRKGPINIGLSCLLPKPGDYMTHDLTGVPILLVRRQDGSLGAFLNAARGLLKAAAMLVCLLARIMLGRMVQMALFAAAPTSARSPVSTSPAWACVRYPLPRSTA
jgi:hypothetical protein